MRWTALCGVLAPAVFTGAWIAGGLLQEGYSARREDISALAAADAEHAWVMIAGLVAAGLLTAAFGVGLRFETGSLPGPALVIFAGLGLAALGLLRNDCSSLTAECKARVAAGEVSWHHTAHDVLSVPVFAAAVLAPLVLARALRRDPRWRSVVPWSLGATPALGVLFLLGGVEAFPSWDGLLQRVAASAAFAWLGAAALHALRLRGRG